MKGTTITSGQLLCKIFDSHAAVLDSRCEDFEIEESIFVSVKDAVDIAQSHDWDWDEWAALIQEISYGYFLTGIPLNTNDAELQASFQNLARLTKLLNRFVEKLRPHTADFMN